MISISAMTLVSLFWKIPPPTVLLSPFPYHHQLSPFSEGASFVVSGWGTTSEGGSLPSNLMQVTVPYVNDDDCSSAYGAGNIVGDVMICAGEGGKDSCQGDSGGPMTYDGTHIGIVSWGYGCARPSYPGVYAQTDAFLDFISSNTH